MLGDNISGDNSSTQLHSKPRKRQTILSFHSLREDVASFLIGVSDTTGNQNPSDILCKH